MKQKTALATKKQTDITQSGALTPGFQSAILAWCNSTTDATSKRRADLLRDKARAVSDFFAWTNKPVNEITAIDVKTWQAELEGRGLAPATVYASISRVSSFYDWMLSKPELAEHVRFNPVNLARPKAPKAYQTESTKSLDDNEVHALLRVVKAKANNGDVVGKRDYAMLVFYLLTGMRRAEVAGLQWGDLKINGGIVVTVRVKGGDIENREISEPAVKAALLEYLSAAGCLDKMQADSPLWTRHDRAGQPGAALTSHAFAKNLKRYAEQAGIGDVHIHQTRHTFARIVADVSGSMIETQDALGHKNLATTKVYVHRVGLKRDKFSGFVAQKLIE